MIMLFITIYSIVVFVSLVRFSYAFVTTFFSAVRQGMIEEFEAITKEAEKNCIISKALNVPITSEAHFVR